MSESKYILTLNSGPEPRIGPGMILERGRERVWIPRAAGDGQWHLAYVRRRRWPQEKQAQMFGEGVSP